MKVINECFEEYFSRHGVQGEDIKDKAGKLIKGKEEAGGKRIRSKICSYDIKDNEYYNGVYEVENYLMGEEFQGKKNKEVV